MPTFIPPTAAGNATFDPRKRETDPAHRLCSYFESWETGQTVWKDSLGVWHTQLNPYLGGSTNTVHDWNASTYGAPDEGLATAQKVYLGGHVHTITDDEATELTAAGFGAYITP
jgi:hypothetical protein